MWIERNLETNKYLHPRQSEGETKSDKGHNSIKWGKIVSGMQVAMLLMMDTKCYTGSVPRRCQVTHLDH